VPGADDPAIQTDILTTLGRDAHDMRAALDHVGVCRGSRSPHAILIDRDAVIAEFRATGGTVAATLSRVILQCYYRDDRGLRSLNLELRAPFPVCHRSNRAIVKARPLMWRRAP
jgi:hypothetical protein